MANWHFNAKFVGDLFDGFCREDTLDNLLYLFLGFFHGLAAREREAHASVS